MTLVFKTALLHFQGLTSGNGRLVLVARAQWMTPESRGGAAAGTQLETVL